MKNKNQCVCPFLVNTVFTERKSYKICMKIILGMKYTGCFRGFIKQGCLMLLNNSGVNLDKLDRVLISTNASPHR